MLKTNHKVSKLGLSFGIALLLSGAASAARATPLPTTSDEARALAAFSLPISSATPVVSRIVTSTDEARASAGGDRLVPVEIERPEESRAVANRVEHH